MHFELLVFFFFFFFLEREKFSIFFKKKESSPETKDLVNLIQPIFISVDPKRDSLKAIKEYTQGT